MPSRTATIASPIGLHARVATDLARKVMASGIAITVGRLGGKTVNGASALAVMMLSIRCGEEVILSTAEPGSEEVLEELVTLLEADPEVPTGPLFSGYPVPDPV